MPRQGENGISTCGGEDRLYQRFPVRRPSKTNIILYSGIKLEGPIRYFIPDLFYTLKCTVETAQDRSQTCESTFTARRPPTGADLAWRPHDERRHSTHPCSLRPNRAKAGVLTCRGGRRCEKAPSRAAQVGMPRYSGDTR